MLFSIAFFCCWYLQELRPKSELNFISQRNAKNSQSCTKFFTQSEESYLLSAFRLPLSTFCPLPSALCNLLSTICPLQSAICLLLSAFCFLPSAFCLLPSAFCLLPSAICLLQSALCLLQSLFQQVFVYFILQFQCI
jgi:hypothetical protein